jgi:hypothetical protein
MKLAITPLTRKIAIANLFRHCHADQAGSPVLLTVLMVAWANEGLRGDDLSNGLNEMLEDGSLSLDTDPRSPSVAFTKAGRDWLERLDPQLKLEQERILNTARQRSQGKPMEKLAPGQEPRWRIVDRRIQLD